MNEEGEGRVLLISGSRYGSFEMMRRVVPAVEKAKAMKYSVIAGDNPNGVDIRVAKLCELYEVPFSYYGISIVPRHHVGYNGNYHQVIVPETIKSDKHRYAYRDRYMVDEADVVLCIWNGKSLGTYAVYQYALRRGIPAKIVRIL